MTELYCFVHRSGKKITDYVTPGTITARPLGLGESQHHKRLCAPACCTGKEPWKSMFLKPNLYTCGCHPSVALDLTLEGELRASFGSGTVMCFYYCALKCIFSFLPRALGLSGSLNSVSRSVWAMKIFWFFLFFALLCWTPSRTTLPAILLVMLTRVTLMRVVSGWVFRPPWSCPLCSMLLMTGQSRIGAFPPLGTWQGEICFFLGSCFYQA